MQTGASSVLHGHILHLFFYYQSNLVLVIINIFQDEFTKGEWLEKTDDIRFADFKFLITYHYLNISGSKSESLDRQSPDNDVEEEEKKEGK